MVCALDSELNRFKLNEKEWVLVREAKEFLEVLYKDRI